MKGTEATMKALVVALALAGCTTVHLATGPVCRWAIHESTDMRVFLRDSIPDEIKTACGSIELTIYPDSATITREGF